MADQESYEEILLPINFVGGASQDALLNPNNDDRAKVLKDGNNVYQFYYYALTSLSDMDNLGYYDTYNNDINNDNVYSREYNEAPSGNPAVTNSNQLSILAAVLSSSAYGVSFEDVAKVNFNSGSVSTADIVIGSTTSGSGISEAAYAMTYGASGTELIHGDLWLNDDITSYWSSADQGSIGYAAIMHELAHSLGLSDFYPTPPITNPLDNQKYSIMSYNLLAGMNPAGAANVTMASGLQLLDIGAIQEIYGRNYDKRNTDTAYSKATSFASGRNYDSFVYTIWDGGGNDTIDAHEYINHALIDLRQGSFSSIGNSASASFNPSMEYGTWSTYNFDFEIGQAKDNVAIAYYAVIENAIGTDYNDILIGNAWNNTLSGGAGDDYIFGDGNEYDSDIGFVEVDPYRAWGAGNAAPSANGSGDDILIGGAGVDHLYGGAGYDIADYSTSPDSVEISIVGLLGNAGNVSSDGFGDYDYFSDVEKFILSSHDDTVGIIATEGVISVDGGAGFDAVHYAYGVHDQKAKTIYSLTGDVSTSEARHDTFVGVEEIKLLEGTLVLTDTKSQVLTGSAINRDSSGDNTLYLSYDLSTSRSGATIEMASYVTATSLGFEQIVRQNSISGTIEVNGAHHEGLLLYSSYTGSTGDSVNFRPRVGINGTNHGDTVLIDGSSSPTTEVYFRSGYGDDDITISPATYYEYTGGNDTIHSGASLQEIIMYGGIEQSDVSFSGDTVTVENLGSIHVEGGTGFTISYMSDNYLGIERTIFGSWGTDAWTGRDSLFETYYALGGNDFLDGGGGDNFLYGGAGDDTLLSYSSMEGGTTSLYGGDGKDVYLVGEDTTTHIHAGLGDIIRFDGISYDDVDFSLSGDTLTITKEWNTEIVVFDFMSIKTYAFSDVNLNSSQLLTGLTGEVQTMDADLVYALPTSENYFLLDGDDEFHGDTAADTVQAGVGWDSIYGYAGNDTLDGWDGYDTLDGGDGNDLLSGGDQDDYLAGGAGDDILDGGRDFDYADYSNAASAITVDLELGTASDGDSGTDQLIDIEAVLGSQYNDTMWGSFRDDTLYGRSGDDILHGGEGSDTLSGSTGDDILDGGDGRDFTYYGTYMSSYGVTVNLLTGTATDSDGDTDTLISIEDVEGTELADTITGNAGINYLYGVEGNDTLDGGAEEDTLDGGDGLDLVRFSAATAGVIVDLDLGTAEDGTGAIDTLLDIENAEGTAYADTVRGSSSVNHLYGLAGADILWGGAGNDTLEGGDGTDKVVYTDAIDGITVNLSTGTGTDSLGGTDTLTGIENIEATLYGDTLTGSSQANVIDALDGWDTVYGLDGADTLNGGTGNDSLYGGAGNDTLSGGDHDDILEGNAGSDTITGGDGTDTVTFTTATAAVTVNLSTGTASDGHGTSDTITGVENIDATGYGDTLTGSSSANTINGFTGVDSLYGLGGGDTVYGGSDRDYIYGDDSSRSSSYSEAGNDTLYGDGGDDRLYGGAGDDLIYGGDDGDYAYGDAGADTLHGEAGEDALYGGDGSDTLYGGNDRDWLHGDDGDDIVYGGAGDDKLYGEAGNDTIYADSGLDEILGGDGNDALYGGADQNWLYGNAGNDTIYGEGGGDLLYGGDGNDVLRGGTGGDNLYGEAGSDTFLYLSGDVDGVRDYITGFTAGSGGDILNLADILSYDSNTDTLSNFIQFTAIASTHTRITVDMDGTGTSYAMTTFAQLQNVTGHSVSDLVTSGNLVVE